MESKGVSLIQPSLRLKPELLAIVAEHIEASEQEGGWRLEQAVDDFSAYVAKLLDHAQGKNLPEGWVPESTFWLVENEGLLGYSSVRHGLTAALERRGGHISYYIRPSRRREGYGTVLLALTLDKARELGLERVLITCRKDSIASVKIIQKNGGKLESEVILEDTGKTHLRYWIWLVR